MCGHSWTTSAMWLMNVNDRVGVFELSWSKFYNADNDNDDNDDDDDNHDDYNNHNDDDNDDNDNEKQKEREDVVLV
jgi:hypothetical protein